MYGSTRPKSPPWRRLSDWQSRNSSGDSSARWASARASRNSAMATAPCLTPTTASARSTMRGPASAAPGPSGHRTSHLQRHGKRPASVVPAATAALGFRWARFSPRWRLFGSNRADCSDCAVWLEFSDWAADKGGCPVKAAMPLRRVRCGVVAWRKPACCVASPCQNRTCSDTRESPTGKPGVSSLEISTYHSRNREATGVSRRRPEYLAARQKCQVTRFPLDTSLYDTYTWSRPKRRNPVSFQRACNDPP